jgi:hypothetical protein
MEEPQKIKVRLTRVSDGQYYEKDFTATDREAAFEQARTFGREELKWTTAFTTEEANELSNPNFKRAFN